LNSPLLADFGVSMQLLGNQSMGKNKGGSPVYMAMEQILGEVVIETDYFAAGMILYNLCGYDNYGEMLGMKSGSFPDIAGRKR
jgi:hypothetical protein